MKSLLVASALLLCASSVFAQDPQFDDGQPKEGNRRVVALDHFVDIYTHPKTSFSCDDKKAGEYYADPETKCSIYYICLANQFNKLSPTSFACPNGTLFSQQTRTCASSEVATCGLATRFYDSIHGSIDSKDKDPKSISSNNRYSSAPWQHNNQPGSNRNQQQPRAQRQPQNFARPVEASAPVAAVQPNLPIPHLNSRRVPQRLVNLPTTTTRAPTTAPATELVEYEYVDYEQPNPNQAQPPAPSQPLNRNRRSPRRKGTLPSVPLDFLPTQNDRSSVTSNFTCSDKIIGLAYADITNNCEMFHLCLPTKTKGKLRDHQMFCNHGFGYNQEKGACQANDTFNCSASEKFFIFNKLMKEESRRKWPEVKKSASSRKPSVASQ